MTLLDRALTKAYARQSAAARAESPTPTSTRRGWVAKLRTPVRRPGAATAPVGPARPVSLPMAVAAATPGLPQRLPTGAGEPAIVRIDEGHDRQGTIPAVPRPPATAWGWPTICERLLQSPAASPGLRGLASLLRELLTERGERNLAFTGQGRAAGRTTLLLCVAKLLAEDPASRVVVVDLDLGRPSLSRRLGTCPTAGLWEVAGGANPGAAILPLIPGRLSLLPLLESVPPSAITANRIARIAGVLHGLREAFDLVLIDAGPRESSLTPHPLLPPAIEACVCVSRHGDTGGELSLCEAYRQAGIDVLGILETFVPAPPAADAAA